ncbi:glyoxalase, partial [bacterium]|nr:glyoxalase [bacterium]
VLGCSVGRTDENWVDLDMYGHQFVLHYKPNHKDTENHFNPVDGQDVPIPHYGVVLEYNEWHKLADNLKSKNVEFVIEPYIRFQGMPGEQCTMFFLDPSGNALEFKAFKNPDQLFAS